MYDYSGNSTSGSFTWTVTGGLPVTLSVSKTGSGSGTVSSPAGIDCGATCSATYDGCTTSVTLTADPATGSIFTGWSGACTDSGACSVTMNGDRTVTATFVPMAEPEAPVVTSIELVGDDVKLTWDAVTVDMNNNPTTIDEYRVYGSSETPYFTPSDPDDHLLGTPEPETPTEYTHLGGSTGTTNWYYLVRAVNVIGPSADSARRVGRFGFTLVPETTP